MSKELLIKMICDGIQEGVYYTVRDLVTRNMGRVSINGYEFKGYLACINSTKEYFDFNMDLLKKRLEKTFSILKEVSILKQKILHHHYLEREQR